MYLVTYCTYSNIGFVAARQLSSRKAPAPLCTRANRESQTRLAHGQQGEERGEGQEGAAEAEGATEGERAAEAGESAEAAAIAAEAAGAATAVTATTASAATAAEPVTGSHGRRQGRSKSRRESHSEI